MPRRPPLAPGTKMTTTELPPDDLGRLYAITDHLGRCEPKTFPSRTRAIRWAIRELAARIEAGSESRGTGPMTEPP